MKSPKTKGWPNGRGIIKHICFWEPTWCPFGNIYFINSFTWVGGKTKCQHLSSETFILCKSRFDYTFLFELMRLWLEWVRWSLNKFRKIDFFVLGPVPSVYDHISVESRITFRRRSLFSTRRPSDQFASIHPMLSASVPCNTTSFCYLGWQSVLRWMKNLNILIIISFFFEDSSIVSVSSFNINIQIQNHHKPWFAFTWAWEGLVETVPVLKVLSPIMLVRGFL